MSIQLADDAPSSEPVRAKVAQIFAELCRGNPTFPSEGMPLIQSIVPALLPEFNQETAYDIGFHLADWIEDAAFLVALHLFPNRFTTAEIETGISAFLIHAPNHVAAAAALFGSPIEDIFEVGALDGPKEDDTPEGV